jgi:gluconolactonase
VVEHDGLRGPSSTNAAMGGNNRDRLYITESVTGTVLAADIGELR